MSTVLCINVRTDGAWSGGGRAVVELFHHAHQRHPELLRLDGGQGVPMYLRNALPPKALAGPYILLPQNAWPWTSWRGSGMVALRWAALRITSWVAMRRAIGVVRLSSAIPKPNDAPSRLVPNVLDPGYERALAFDGSLPEWIRSAEGSFLSVGSISPYRNFPRLLEAHALYREHGGRRPLVIVGAPMSRELGRQLFALTTNRPAVSVVADPQSRHHILAAMRGCQSVVLPSLVEASPLTLLEGLASGVPVAASMIPGHLETAGVHARHVVWMDPQDANTMMQALLAVDRAVAPAWPHVNDRWRAIQRDLWADAMAAALQAILSD